jgi:NitT/TauT family transport system permease protein
MSVTASRSASSVATGTEAEELTDAERAAIEVAIAPKRIDRIITQLSYFSPLLLLLVWEGLSRAGILDARFFPPPSKILVVLWQDLASGELLTDVLATLSRFLVGYAMGVIPAIIIGVTLGLFSRVRQLISPIFQALYPVPKIAIFPLILFIFGVGEMSKYVIIAIGAFFPVLFNTLSGIVQMPQIYSDVAHNAGANPIQRCVTVIFPAVLPNIFTGLRLAAGVSYVLIAAAEFVGAKSGVGYYIWMSWETFTVGEMFAGIIVISTMGYLTLLLLDGLEYLLVPKSAR